MPGQMTEKTYKQEVIESLNELSIKNNQKEIANAMAKVFLDSNILDLQKINQLKIEEIKTLEQKAVENNIDKEEKIKALKLQEKNIKIKEWKRISHLLVETNYVGLLKILKLFSQKNKVNKEDIQQLEIAISVYLSALPEYQYKPDISVKDATSPQENAAIADDTVDAINKFLRAATKILNEINAQAHYDFSVVSLVFRFLWCLIFPIKWIYEAYQARKAGKNIEMPSFAERADFVAGSIMLGLLISAFVVIAAAASAFIALFATAVAIAATYREIYSTYARWKDLTQKIKFLKKIKSKIIKVTAHEPSNFFENSKKSSKKLNRYLSRYNDLPYFKSSTPLTIAHVQAELLKARREKDQHTGIGIVLYRAASLLLGAAALVSAGMILIGVLAFPVGIPLIALGTTIGIAVASVSSGVGIANLIYRSYKRSENRVRKREDESKIEILKFKEEKVKDNVPEQQKSIVENEKIEKHEKHLEQQQVVAASEKVEKLEKQKELTTTEIFNSIFHAQKDFSNKEIIDFKKENIDEALKNDSLDQAESAKDKDEKNEKIENQNDEAMAKNHGDQKTENPVDEHLNLNRKN